jgi:hypothetical protein
MLGKALRTSESASRDAGCTAQGKPKPLYRTSRARQPPGQPSRLALISPAMVTQAVKAPLEGDGVIVIECMDRNGSLRFVELILRYKQDPGVDRSSQTSPDDISEINQPGEAYEEERGKAYEEPGNTYYEEDNPDLIPWIFDIGLPDVIVHPAHEPDRKQAYERPTGTHLTIEKPVREGPAKVRRGKQRQSRSRQRSRPLEPSASRPARTARRIRHPRNRQRQLPSPKPNRPNAQPATASRATISRACSGLPPFGRWGLPQPWC